MAPNANKPGPKIPAGPADRRSAVRKAHDLVTAQEEEAREGSTYVGSDNGGSDNGGSAPHDGPDPSSRTAEADSDTETDSDRETDSNTETDSKPARGGGKKKAAATARKGAAKTAGKLFESTSSGGGAGGKTFAAVALKSGGRAAKTLAKKAVPAGAQTARKVASWVGGSSRESVMDRARQLPIQRYVDVAVPLEVAWDQWMKFDYFPEGAHRVEDVEREGDHLVGQVASPAADDWEAEIIEERPEESFAWQSIDGSDCAGLVTFHRLSDRLTRIELNLDVRPTGLAEALALSLHLADRRAEADLRRFKAHAELLNPDTYQDIVDDS